MTQGRQRKYNFVTHVILIFMLFLLPEILMGLSSSRPGHSGMRWMAYAKSLVFISVFYANFYFIINRTLTVRPRRPWQFLGLNLAVIAIALTALWGIWAYAASQFPERPKFMTGNWKMMSLFLRDMVMIVLTIALSVAVRISAAWTAFERHNRELLASQRDAELNGLKSQLNPHFLFNTLNAIYALIAIAPEKAQDAVHELSNLLRYVIYENPERVTLERELAFTRSYIGLMRMRHSNLPVVANISSGKDGRYDSAQVPPLLFVSLLENAFKYGNTGSKEHPVVIDIHADDKGVVCTTTNHFIPPKDSRSASSGIGLANLRRRIDIIYGGRASLSTSTSPAEPDVFIASLHIPLESETSQSPKS